MKGIAILFVIALCFFGACSKEKVEFDQLIVVIDGELTIGALTQAEDNILKSLSVATGRPEWLTLLKRAYVLGSATGSFETLYKVSKAALANISGAEEIAALYVYSGLRTGRDELAEDFLEGENSAVDIVIIDLFAGHEANSLGNRQRKNSFLLELFQ